MEKCQLNWQQRGVEQRQFDGLLLMVFGNHRSEKKYLAHKAEIDCLTILHARIHRLPGYTSSTQNQSIIQKFILIYNRFRPRWVILS